MKQLLRCAIVGVGADGRGDVNWQELSNCLSTQAAIGNAAAFVVPKPALIPANERRRAPLPVKLAVEVSTQATEGSHIPARDTACVFGSGLGDTEITDYMCRTLTTEQKLLSPTKFHNSVHNAAAGYWTISSGCQKSANSVAAYYETAALSLLEAMSHCTHHQEPVLLTLFDIKAHSAYRDVFACDEHFAAALVLCPETNPRAANASAWLELRLATDSPQQPTASLSVQHPDLDALTKANPAARILPLLEALALIEQGKIAECDFDMKLSPSAQMHIRLRK